MQNIFIDIGIIIIIATLFAYLARLLRQPLIPAYIITGLVIGPIYGLITNTSTIHTLSEIGIAFLLFIVGLDIDFRKLKNVSFVSSAGGLIQSFTLFIIGFVIAIGFGFVQMEAAYIGLILAFSSTMVVIKLLSDKREIDTLHARMIIGFLLMEDFLAVLALSIITTLSEFTFSLLVLSFIKGIIVALVAFFSSKYIFPYIYKFAAKSQELLFLTSIASCFLFALLFYYIGFSIAIGAFAAGLTLGNLPYSVEIISKVKSLKDFFATIFFVSLGMTMVLANIQQFVIPAIVILLIVLLFKPLLCMTICSLFGYKKRPSFLTAISLAETSEFSLIMVSLGFTLGHISQNILSLAIIIAIITMTIATYTIKYDDTFYKLFSKKLNIFEKLSKKTRGLEHFPDKLKYDVVLCGYNRIGYSIIKTLKRSKKSVLVVDFNPEVINRLVDEGTPCIYGDVGDIEVIDRIDFKKVKLLISTVPQRGDNKLLIKRIKELNKKTIVFVTASQVEDALKLYKAGADYVILPHFLGGEYVSLMISKFKDNFKKALKGKMKFVKELEQRRRLGHEHPAHH